jgi:hypothetical protein
MVQDRILFTLDKEVGIESDCGLKSTGFSTFLSGTTVLLSALKMLVTSIHKLGEFWKRVDVSDLLSAIIWYLVG